VPVSWLLLLPPSRGVREGGDPDVTWRDTALADGPAGTARRRAIAAARKLRAAELADAIGGTAAVPDARRMLGDVHRAPTLPAVERYAGVVYDHLDVTSLPAAARRRAHDHVLVPSALFGPVRGGDPIPAYRLLMLATLPEPVGRLASHWRPHVAARLDEVLAPDATVVDLLSAEYAAAVPAAARRDRHWVTVDFVDGSGTKVPGTIGKQRKGALARHLLAAGRATPDVAGELDGARLRAAEGDRWVLEVDRTP
jgi:cytoplasmic iron level regulating protein YaaA (DUF328/UPF0246 family)